MRLTFRLPAFVVALILLASNARLAGQSAPTLATLHNFTGSGTDGYGPEARLVQGIDGNLYGTTRFGGASSGYGTVFQITPAGVLTTLYGFTGTATDGGWPEGNLIQSSDGNFYGTSWYGGSTAVNHFAGNGTVFQVTPAGVLTTLHSFSAASTDGINPDSALAQGSDGNFYGTTENGRKRPRLSRIRTVGKR